MKAIIVAAGIGSRMYPLAQDMPKCLLPICNETFLGRQIRLFNECGVDDITVVVGFRKEYIIEKFPNITMVYNPHYLSTNSLYSLWVARNRLLGDTIITNADVLFNKGTLEMLVNSQYNYCLVVGKKVVDVEDHKVKIAGNRVVEVNKTMPLDEAFGEFIGLAKVSGDKLNTFKKYMQYRIEEDSQAFWVSAFQNLIYWGYEVDYSLAKPPWIEVDTKEDYEEATKLCSSL